MQLGGVSASIENTGNLVLIDAPTKGGVAELRRPDGHAPAGTEFQPPQVLDVVGERRRLERRKLLAHVEKLHRPVRVMDEPVPVGYPNLDVLERGGLLLYVPQAGWRV